MSKPTPNAVPRRKRFNVAIDETFSTTFTILAMNEEEAEIMAEAMAEQQSFPPEAREHCERSVNVWRNT